MNEYTIFLDNTLLINEHVLLPRKKTEITTLVAIKELKSISSNEAIKVLDIGTGSGAIILSMCKEIKKSCWSDRVRFYGSDVSPEALTVAKINAESMGFHLDVDFIESDLLKEIYFMPDLIVANLPYLNELNRHLADERTLKEPSIAVFDIDNNAGYARKLISEIKRSTKKPKILIIENSEFSVDGLLDHINIELSNIMGEIYYDDEMKKRGVIIRWI